MKTQERPITYWDYIFSKDERGYDLILLKTNTQDGKHAHGNKPYIQHIKVLELAIAASFAITCSPQHYSAEPVHVVPDR
jgi:hypothetical protein